MKTYLGHYRGIVIQNNDPHQSGRVKVWVPHIMATLYTDWNQELKNKKFQKMDENSDLTASLLQKLKEILPWAEVMQPLSEGSASTVKPDPNIQVSDNSSWPFVDGSNIKDVPPYPKEVAIEQAPLPKAKFEKEDESSAKRKVITKESSVGSAVAKKSLQSAVNNGTLNNVRGSGYGYEPQAFGLSSNKFQPPIISSFYIISNSSLKQYEARSIGIPLGSIVEITGYNNVFRFLIVSNDVSYEKSYSSYPILELPELPDFFIQEGYSNVIYYPYKGNTPYDIYSTGDRDNNLDFNDLSVSEINELKKEIPINYSLSNDFVNSYLFNPFLKNQFSIGIKYARNSTITDIYPTDVIATLGYRNTILLEDPIIGDCLLLRVPEVNGIIIRDFLPHIKGIMPHSLEDIIGQNEELTKEMVSYTDVVTFINEVETTLSTGYKSDYLKKEEINNIVMEDIENDGIVEATIYIKAANAPFEMSVHYNRNGSIRSFSKSDNINVELSNKIGVKITSVDSGKTLMSIPEHQNITLIDTLFANAKGDELFRLNRGPIASSFTAINTNKVLNSESEKNKSILLDNHSQLKSIYKFTPRIYTGFNSAKNMLPLTINNINYQDYIISQNNNAKRIFNAFFKIKPIEVVNKQGTITGVPTNRVLFRSARRSIRKIPRLGGTSIISNADQKSDINSINNHVFGGGGYGMNNAGTIEGAGKLSGHIPPLISGWYHTNAKNHGTLKCQHSTQSVCKGNKFKGIVHHPEIGAHVWVIFEEGDPLHPIVVGTITNQADIMGLHDEVTKWTSHRTDSTQFPDLKNRIKDPSGKFEEKSPYYYYDEFEMESK